MQKATGEFSVKMMPEGEGGPIGKMSLDKAYHGPLEATAKGEFLSVMGEAKGSAGYVAMERVTGKLDGKTGSFALMHFGTMHQGQQHLRIEVVPGSGTGELGGLSGTMGIRIEGGKHFYDFEYTLG